MMDRNKEPVYSISVAAKLLKVTPRILRTYEEMDLINPFRTEGKTRLYSEKDMKKLELICYLHREKEVNLPGIKIILGLLLNQQKAYKQEEKTHKEANEIKKRAREIAPELLVNDIEKFSHDKK